jgi:hypothetical protein
MDETTMQAGLLMESAQAQQRSAESAIRQLSALTQELDVVVRETLRRAFVEELQALGTAVSRATEALRVMGRAANVRTAVWSTALTITCSVGPAIGAWVLLPSRAEVSRLRDERDALVRRIALLEQGGGRIDLRRCGDTARLCVRVDRAAPAFGKEADYLIVKGY